MKIANTLIIDAGISGLAGAGIMKANTGGPVIEFQTRILPKIPFILSGFKNFQARLL